MQNTQRATLLREQETEITPSCLILVSAQLLYALFLIIITVPTSTAKLGAVIISILNGPFHRFIAQP